MTGPYFAKIPRRIARLHLPGRVLWVLIAIASYATNKEGIARVSLDKIATETEIERTKVRACVRRLEDEGVLETVRGGGRGNATIFRIISDAEASPPAATSADETASAPGNGANGAASDRVTGSNSDENGADFSPRTGPFSVANGAADGPPTERTERTEPPLRGGRARTREGGGSDSGSVGRQARTPIDGAVDGDPPNWSIEDYLPSPEIIAWAAGEVPEVDPCERNVLGNFRDWHLQHGTVFRDGGAADAAYRIWLRRERLILRRQQRSAAPEGRARMALNAVLGMIEDG